MPDTIVKSNPDAPPLFFEAEAAGLEWLASAGGARVVRVVNVAPGSIELERVPTARPDAGAARAFGAALAVTHDAGAAAFGAPPDGWDGPLFIGRRPLPEAHEATWGEFYARDRVLPYLELAVEAGGIGRGQASIVRQACDEIVAGVFDDDEPPARIHGDLWNGKVTIGACSEKTVRRSGPLCISESRRMTRGTGWRSSDRGRSAWRSSKRGAGRSSANTSIKASRRASAR